jgi:hypothetical protein
MIARDFHDVPRKRALGALLLIGALAGLGAGALDRARGVPSTFQTLTPGLLDPRLPGEPAAAPMVSTGGAAAFHESATQ